MRMNGCTHFKCNGGCDMVRPISEQHIVKTAYTCFDHTTDRKFSYEIHHVQMCDKCYGGEDGKD